MADDSEFMCCVVRVADVCPHPGADRLELASFTVDGKTTFPYQLVVGRNEFEVGDYGVYISPDSVVPISGPFAFLSSRLDAKGKERYRIRSAKLRGVFSPGLLVPAGPGVGDRDLGKDVSEQLGVAKWEPVENGIDGDELTLNPSGKKLLPPIDPYPIYSVTALKKCSWLFEEGEDVVVTEKIHGTNFRFGYGGRDKFYYGTHRTPLVDVRSWWQKLADWTKGKRRRINHRPGFGNPWSEAVEKFELEDVCRFYPDFVFYGELFGTTSTGRKIQDLTYGVGGLGLMIFDIWHAGEQRWLAAAERYGDVKTCLNKLGLAYVATLHRGPYSADLIKRLAEEDSVYGGIREGVIIESTAGLRRKAKWVSERYHLRAA
jgi:RNA ligase (TIGR02306 family)